VKPSRSVELRSESCELAITFLDGKDDLLEAVRNVWDIEFEIECQLTESNLSYLT